MALVLGPSTPVCIQSFSSVAGTDTGRTFTSDSQDQHVLTVPPSPGAMQRQTDSIPPPPAPTNLSAISSQVPPLPPALHHSLSQKAFLKKDSPVLLHSRSPPLSPITQPSETASPVSPHTPIPQLPPAVQKAPPPYLSLPGSCQPCSTSHLSNAVRGTDRSKQDRQCFNPHVSPGLQGNSDDFPGKLPSYPSQETAVWSPGETTASNAKSEKLSDKTSGTPRNGKVCLASPVTSECNCESPGKATSAEARPALNIPSGNEHGANRQPTSESLDSQASANDCAKQKRLRIQIDEEDNASNEQKWQLVGKLSGNDFSLSSGYNFEPVRSSSSESISVRPAVLQNVHSEAGAVGPTAPTPRAIGGLPSPSTRPAPGQVFHDGSFAKAPKAVLKRSSSCNTVSHQPCAMASPVSPVMSKTPWKPSQSATVASSPRLVPLAPKIKPSPPQLPSATPVYTPSPIPLVGQRGAAILSLMGLNISPSALPPLIARPPLLGSMTGNLSLAPPHIAVLPKSQSYSFPPSPRKVLGVNGKAMKRSYSAPRLIISKEAQSSSSQNEVQSVEHMGPSPHLSQVAQPWTGNQQQPEHEMNAPHAIQQWGMPPSPGPCPLPPAAQPLNSAPNFQLSGPTHAQPEANQRNVTPPIQSCSMEWVERLSDIAHQKATSMTTASVKPDTSMHTSGHSLSMDSQNPSDDAVSKHPWSTLKRKSFSSANLILGGDGSGEQQQLQQHHHHHHHHHHQQLQQLHQQQQQQGMAPGFTQQVNRPHFSPISERMKSPSPTVPQGYPSLQVASSNDHCQGNFPPLQHQPQGNSSPQVQPAGYNNVTTGFGALRKSESVCDNSMTTMSPPPATKEFSYGFSGGSPSSGQVAEFACSPAPPSQPFTPHRGSVTPGPASRTHVSPGSCISSDGSIAAACSDVDYIIQASAVELDDSAWTEDGLATIDDFKLQEMEVLEWLPDDAETDLFDQIDDVVPGHTNSANAGIQAATFNSGSTAAGNALQPAAMALERGELIGINGEIGHLECTEDVVQLWCPIDQEDDSAQL